MGFQGQGDYLESETDGRKIYGTLNYYSDRLAYVNGGLTFNYPAGLFSDTPYVVISITSKNLLYAVGLIISPLIVAHTKDLLTIRVNAGTLIAIAEAATDGVEVTIDAKGE